MKKKPGKKYVRRHEIPEGKESAVLLKTVRLAKLLKTIASGKENIEAEIVSSHEGPLGKKILKIVKQLKDSSKS